MCESIATAIRALSPRLTPADIEKMAEVLLKWFRVNEGSPTDIRHARHAARAAAKSLGLACQEEKGNE